MSYTAAPNSAWNWGFEAKCPTLEHSWFNTKGSERENGRCTCAAVLRKQRAVCITDCSIFSVAGKPRTSQVYDHQALLVIVTADKKTKFKVSAYVNKQLKTEPAQALVRLRPLWSLLNSGRIIAKFMRGHKIWQVIVSEPRKFFSEAPWVPQKSHFGELAGM